MIKVKKGKMKSRYKSPFEEYNCPASKVRKKEIPEYGYEVIRRDYSKTKRRKR